MCADGPLGTIQSLLRQEIGLDTRSVGLASLRRVIVERMEVCGILDGGLYARHLCQSADELQNFIESIVVPETYFFRHAKAYQTLIGLVRTKWLPSNPKNTLRILSLPCSTGEEPYSVAMALIDAGLRAEQFRIDAVDVSSKALARAKRGLYGRGAFRSPDLAFRDRHFTTTADGELLAKAIRDYVTFRQGNILKSTTLPGGAPYDFIFCRNVLIYFHDDAQDYAVKTLRGLLSPSGYLFVGPSEVPLLLSHGFRNVDAPMAFVLRPFAPESTVQCAAPSVIMRERPALLPSWGPSPAARQPEISGDAIAADSLQRTAHGLAGEGRLIDAELCCEQFLTTHGPSADICFLLGVIRDAKGQADAAVQAYRQTLRLDPDHDEAAVHLALLLKRQHSPYPGQAADA